MDFDKIDLDSWARKEHYIHFLHEVECSYSVTLNLDISPLKGERLYPAMLWLLAGTVNALPEFRTALRADGPGVYRTMHPAYTIFNPDRKIFTSVWTPYQKDYRAFLKAYLDDTAVYGRSTHYISKPDRPGNSFDVSMVPWLHFTSFNLNIHSGGSYLLPIFTMGRFEEKEGKRLLPLAIQVHHAVCDGYHVGQFAALLQEDIFRFPGEGPWE